MNEIIFYVTLALCLTTVTSQSKYKCPQGTVVYPFGTEEVLGLNATVATCPTGWECRFYAWNNTDRNTNEKAYVETGYCSHPVVPYGCDGLEELEGVGIVDDCVQARCEAEADTCELSFRSTICDLETVAYTMDKKITVFNSNAGTKPCKIGKTCGMYRWINTDHNYTSFVETGVCVDPTKPQPTCQDLITSPNVTGKVSDCNFTTCPGDRCETFEISQPNRGYRCDQGVFAFDPSRSKLYLAANVTSAPCPHGDACGMFRFTNIDKDGNQSYVEVGFCSPIADIQYTTCESLEKSDDVQNAKNCSVEFCSGDFCQEFSHLQATEDCPERAHWDDIQILPGCTFKEALSMTFECVGKFVEGIPFANNETGVCNNVLDGTISCLSDTLQLCLAFENDDETPCPSVLDFIGDVAPTFKMIKEAASTVHSLQDIKNLVASFNITMSQEDLNALDAICSSPTNHSALLEGLKNATSALMGVSLNIGPPVCSDTMIVDDVIEWALEMSKDLLEAEQHKNVCLSYDKFKVRMVDAVVNRCFDFDHIGELLVGEIGSYYAKLLQRGINIVKQFLFELDVPRCSSVPFPSHKVCHQGTVVSSLDMETVYQEIDVNATVCEVNMECGMLRFVSTDHMNNTAYVESGFCNHPNYTATCDVLKNNPQIKEYRNCTVETCSNDNRCLKFKNNQCKEVEKDDVAVLPRCSLKKSLHQSFECMGPFVTGYPYQSKGQCRVQVDDMAKCLAFTATTCLSGDCPTILDVIPGIRVFYKEVMRGASKAHSLGDALRLIPGMSNEIVDGIYSLICDEPGTPIPDLIKQFIKGLDLIQFGEPLCKNDILDRLVNISFKAAKAVSEDRSHEQLCMAFSTMKTELWTTFREQCDPSKLHEILQNISGGSMMGLASAIMKAMEIGSSFFDELEIPSCMGGGNMTMPDCSRFNTMTSQCGMRQAWLCDYVSWKLHFLNVWLIRFNEYRSSNMMEALPIPECPSIASDMCVNENMMRCGTAAGCRMCFCEDQRYKDMSKVMTMWREDYARWKKVMMVYSDVNAGADQCAM